MKKRYVRTNSVLPGIPHLQSASLAKVAPLPTNLRKNVEQFINQGSLVTTILL